MEDIVKRIKYLDSINPADTVKRTLKLNEEVGELAAAVLAYTGYKVTDFTDDQIEDNILEEGCDILIVLLSILTSRGFTLQQIKQKANLKLDKWKAKMHKQKI